MSAPSLTPEAEALLTGIDGPDPLPELLRRCEAVTLALAPRLATEAWRATTYEVDGAPESGFAATVTRVGRWDSVGEVRGPTREAAAANLLADLRRRLAERVAGLQAVLDETGPEEKDSPR